MATSLNQDAWVKTALRLPQNLHAQLHAAARASDRSLNQEIVRRLQVSLVSEALEIDDNPSVTVTETLIAKVDRLETLVEHVLEAVGSAPRTRKE